MPMYRVYFVDREGHIERPPEVIQCADDKEAAEKAKQFIDGQDIEVWDQARLVVKYPHK
jgi:hypothetical protein